MKKKDKKITATIYSDSYFLGMNYLFIFIIVVSQDIFFFNSLPSEFFLVTLFPQIRILLSDFRAVLLHSGHWRVLSCCYFLPSLINS